MRRSQCIWVSFIFAVWAATSIAHPHNNAIHNPLQRRQPVLAKRFVNIPGPPEADLFYKSKPQKQHTKLYPQYPNGIDDPVDSGSWLMDFASKIAPYWTYLETPWKPCQRAEGWGPLWKDKDSEDSTDKCVPSCKDIHSHTRLGFFANCTYVELCAFATFVLPDSQCPGRVNSYKMRCSISNQAELFSSWQYNLFASTIIRPEQQKEYEDVVKGMSEGSHITPAECSERTSARLRLARRQEAGTPAAPIAQYPQTSDLDRRIPSIETGLILYTSQGNNLSKRGYEYRKYLDGANLFRPYIIIGPGHPMCQVAKEPNPPLPLGLVYRSGFCPFSCEAWHVESHIAQYIRPQTIDKRITICRFSVLTKDYPDERCPGIGSAVENCPSNEEQLVATIKGQLGMTDEEVKALLKKEREIPLPCSSQDQGTWEDCKGGSILDLI
ncbi:hypothetical protein BJ508DRAFT_178098 [Ascobolus immersus RN42]|uniref:Uncharacterized protein n=1 Tax=Ascobolus immersus RN42 TaxID=1160509 RepID=A0A3N4IHC2_ASCIM|nr:hypothetical protein BJ508DRAFT_178098 [Ascobolus immersus RN42]